jgi:hypothetical protein
MFICEILGKAPAQPCGMKLPFTASRGQNSSHRPPRVEYREERTNIRGLFVSWDNLEIILGYSWEYLLYISPLKFTQDGERR